MARELKKNMRHEHTRNDTKHQLLLLLPTHDLANVHTKVGNLVHECNRSHAPQRYKKRRNVSKTLHHGLPRWPAPSHCTFTSILLPLPYPLNRTTSTMRLTAHLPSSSGSSPFRKRATAAADAAFLPRSLPLDALPPRRCSCLVLSHSERLWERGVPVR